MNTTPPDTAGASRQPTPDRGLALDISVFAIAMLTLFTVLAVADAVGLARMAPFIALPMASLVVAAILAWQRLTGEAQVSAAFAVARRDHEKGNRR